MRDTQPQPRTVGALVQALRILRHLSARGTPEGVSAIARATGVNGSTCFNILRTLAAEGLVVFDAGDKSYRLGLGVLELAIGLLGANPGDLIRPELERLAAAHGALICLWHITDTDRLVLIERAYDPAAIRVELPPGKRLPALVGGVGRVIAACRNYGEVELRRRFADLRWESPPRFEDYRKSIDDAAKRGYGLDIGQLYVGVDVVGAVVTDTDSRPRYGISSITLHGQTTAESRARIGRDLTESCRHLGHALFPRKEGTENH
ncbi:MAG: transcriptional regulator, IclR family [Rhodobacteraceae bacterium HLUCCA12]|nr:MAG: transcriptional regulator, IclR family [Rhodobacteraceae bacterium HLUCCA12]